MKLTTTTLAVLAAVIPTIWSLPTELALREYKLPTCGAESCLVQTAEVFDACAPSDLACLCTLEQSEVTRYVNTVQPCIDGDAGKAACTDGARYQYKDLLKSVCADDRFGNKAVEFPPTA
ncbi:uncharacterized protein K460DRAFT_410927 [Cucurbitaria berberidis CBS 394.84]|uniref:CFEM domain-containing protein n=1 Tax=Cucurbitaria berberidis CBS 394.84 TaxID=1168544 RepID=A0A9P4G786_9PLEO|nr:uncharacterized protein K460DRAFT_410927 [Cucurbitaria berberidis CBS 394.84]KAF1840333.1 hypothetical protein K460DRAFT_410927 [Cucurbitaria berberidis CBS 394.84]